MTSAEIVTDCREFKKLLRVWLVINFEWKS